MKENKQRMYLRAEAILKYLTGNEKLHTLITTQNTEIDLVTTDQSLYEALGSIDDRAKIDMNLLVKLLEVTTIVPFKDMMKHDRKVLTPERAEELRNKVDIEDE
ncbi:hypothetical protein JXB31_00400 [Candidatus Woesearchaeota archaeon]|nr:hypothetical protein [Candidatus Woesearchaeota archaeon]